MTAWPIDDAGIDHDRACEHYAWLWYEATLRSEGVASDNTTKALGAWMEANRVLATRVKRY